MHPYSLAPHSPFPKCQDEKKKCNMPGCAVLHKAGVYIMRTPRYQFFILRYSYTMSEDRTTIIVSNLAKGDFIREQGRSLSLADLIKLAILNLDLKAVYDIIHWSNLPSLSRIIIIFLAPAAATRAYKFLESTYEAGHSFALPRTAKLSLQENLLQRSRSSDNLREKELNVTASLENFRNFHNSGSGKYEEPVPRQFDAYGDLAKLGIDLSAFNSQEQLDELRTESSSAPPSPSKAIGRSRSLTKTLFKPSLTVDTGGPTHRSPASPTITLDETF